MTDDMETNKRILEACRIAYTSRTFVGKGRAKLTRREIEAISVERTVDLIKEFASSKNHPNPKVQQRMAHVYSSGLVKIYDQQVSFLEEDCEKLWSISTHTASDFTQDTSQEDAYSPPSQQKKRRSRSKTSKKNQEAIDIVDKSSDKQLIASDDFLIGEFQVNSEKRKQAVTLIDEDEFRIPPSTSAVDFGYGEGTFESTFGEAVTGITGVPQEEIPVEVGDVEGAAALPETPKRKSQRPHDETPTKRKRGSPTTSSGSKARRSIFNDSEAMPAENPRPNDPTVLPIDLQEANRSHLSIEQDDTIEKSGADSGSRIDSEIHETLGNDVQLRNVPSIIVTSEERSNEPEIQDVYLPKNDDSDLPAMPEGASDARENEVELPPVVRDELELQPLEENLLPARRKKRRPLMDNVKQIKLKEFLVGVHTIKMEKAIMRIREQVPAQNLLYLPSHNMRRTTSNDFLPWGRRLMENFEDAVYACIESQIEVNSSISLPRRLTLPVDNFVNKSPRSRRSRRDSRDSLLDSANISAPQLAPRRPSSVAGDASADMDRHLMPPPVIPSVPQSPRPKSLPNQFPNSPQAVSPKSRISRSIPDSELTDPPSFEPEAAETREQAFEPDEHNMEQFQAAQSTPKRTRSIQCTPPQSPSARSVASSTLSSVKFVNREQFWDLIDLCWGEDDTIDFDNFMMELEATRPVVVKGILYLFVFENQGRVRLRQDQRYGEVIITRGDIPQ